MGGVMNAMNWEDIDKCQSDLSEALDILDEIEWIAIPGKKDKMCPVCRWYSAYGHDRYRCPLPRLLGGVRDAENSKE